MATIEMSNYAKADWPVPPLWLPYPHSLYRSTNDKSAKRKDEVMCLQPSASRFLGKYGDTYLYIERGGFGACTSFSLDNV
jgi:hypothetical protein